MVTVLTIISVLLLICFIVGAWNGYGGYDNSDNKEPPARQTSHHRSPPLMEIDWIGKRYHRHDATIERHRRSAESSNDHYDW